MNNELINIENKDGVMVVSSREVAEHFGKKHTHVIRAIEEKIKVSPILGSPQYFIENTYLDKSNRQSKEYLMTRDGFSFLVMGFTGRKADEWKIKYIEAFNKMEETIRDNSKKVLPSNYKEALQQLIENEEEKERLQIENSQKEQVINELKPKADYTDTILKSKSIVPITSIAKDYGMSGTAMNDKLHELGVQYKMGNQWLLYAKYQDKGYTHSETINITHKDGTQGTTMNTKWTQKGRLFLYNLLKDNELLPMIEREI